ncbi:hypothetical protein HH310_23005 [Actinoplanes sp. TBRC 11911]|uniref:hypothetical protein n=1 Tax=Actinoplanes sp. TBRC 11911 TaxID=2729386 RepID=UPI00145DA996|nr:hypothetical protein [Actinoplanes sp. TBRC 11911]NMO54039.1 hypothetical protein [Actinoplanes sp. TBRC 11911]
MHTYATALARSGVSVPDHLVADAVVPILDGPQAQGDLMIVPVDAPPRGLAWETVPDAGIQVIYGEATGNTHWLHRGLDSPSVRWVFDRHGVRLGYLEVAPDNSALLIHTDEHGANGIGPGYYAIHRKRAQDVRLTRPGAEYLVAD